MSISSPPPVKNKAYTPLRRQSSSLYSTSSSGLKARYNLPPASPSYIGLGGLPSYPNLGGTYDLGGGGGGGFGMDGLAGEKSDYGNGGKVVDVLRGGLDKMRRGLADAGKLDKSWSLVWG